MYFSVASIIHDRPSECKVFACFAAFFVIMRRLFPVKTAKKNTVWIPVAYLKEHRPGLYSSLILSGKLYEHLAKIERICQGRLKTMIQQMAKHQGITEKLKALDQLGWVGRMNVIHHSAEEIILAEIIYE